jgi:hypothetical protein
VIRSSSCNINALTRQRTPDAIPVPFSVSPAVALVTFISRFDLDRARWGLWLGVIKGQNIPNSPVRKRGEGGRGRGRGKGKGKINEG